MTAMSGENYNIPRISVASSINDCILGIGGYYYNRNADITVYEIILNDDIRIVKPTKKLVPDADKTNEYWLLDEVKIKNIGIIKLYEKDKELKYKWKLKNK